MAVNLDHILEVITHASNALGRAKDALLKEKERAEAPVEERLTAAQWAAQMDRDSYTMRESRENVRNDVRQAAMLADTPPETKPATKASGKSS